MVTSGRSQGADPQGIRPGVAVPAWAPLHGPGTVLVYFEPVLDFRAYVDSSPDLIVRYDRDLRRTYVNRAVVRALGCRADDLVGRLVGEFGGDRTRPPDLATVDLIRRRVGAVFAGAAFDTFEIILQQPLGLRTLACRLHLEQRGDGSADTVLLVARDITELKEAVRHTLALAENSPDLIGRFDLEGRYLYANAALVRVERIPAEELMGRRIGEGQLAGGLPQGIAVLRAALARVAQTGRNEEVEVRIPRPYRSRVYQSRLIAERDQTGRVVSVLHLGHDVTERHHNANVRQRLLARLIRVREDERRTLARELHDSIGQAVTALAYGTELVLQADDLAGAREHAEHLRALAAETLEGLRRLAHGLHPRVLDDLGLEAAVERRATDFIASFGIAVDVAVSGVRTPRLPRETEAALYRIFTEALTNVARHSGASRASVVLRRQPEHVDLIVEDDGAGFEPDALLRDERSDAFGLRGMLEDASVSGGTARIESALGRGTTVAVRIPL